MHLTRKDLVATIAVIGTVLATLAVLGGWGWPLLGSVRTGAAVVLVLSMAMCGMGNATDSKVSMDDRYVRFMTGFGILIFGTAVVAMITAEELWLVVETAMIVGMWLVTTLRHAFVGQSHHPVPTH